MKKIIIILSLLFYAIIGHSQFVIISSSGFHDPADTINNFVITTLNKVGQTSLADSLISYWALEETSGTIAYDSVTDYNGSFIGSPTLNQEGKVGKCYLFGGNQYIDFGNNYWVPDTSDITIVGWFELTELDVYKSIFGNIGADSWFFIYITSDNILHASVNFGEGSDTTNFQIESNNALEINKGYNCIIIIDRDGRFSMNLNDITQTDYDSIDDFEATQMYNTNHLVLSGGNFKGYMDEWGVYSKKLSTVEMAQYNQGVSYPFYYDSLRLQMSNFDPDADSIMIIYKYGSPSTSRNDGYTQFAFPINDSSAYKDTTFYYLWAGGTETKVFFTGWSGIDDEWSPIPNKDTTVFTHIPFVAAPDTAVSFIASTYDIGTVRIDAEGFYPPADSIILNYALYVSPYSSPLTRNSTIRILASADTSDFQNLRYIIPVEQDSTAYNFKLWCKYGDYWTAIANEDSTILNTVEPVINVFVTHTGGNSTLSDGLIAFYQFEETSGSILYDTTDNDYDGTLMNTPTQGETGVNGNCYYFAGNTAAEYIDLGTSFWHPGTSDWTIAFRSKVTGTNSTYGGVFGQYGSTPNFYIRQPRNAIGPVNGVVNFGGGNITTVTNSALTDDTWYNEIYEFDRDANTSIYINDSQQTDQDDISGSVAVNVTNSNHTTIGNIGGTSGPTSGYYHQGWIDDLGVWSRLLTSDEKTEYDNGATYPFSSDSLRFQMTAFDIIADTHRIMYRYDSIPTSPTDGTLLSAFSDTTGWDDTVLIWPGLSDTSIFIGIFSGKIIGEDSISWTVNPAEDSLGLFYPDTAAYFDVSFSHLDTNNELNNGLFAYYNFEESSGDLIDQFGNNDLPVISTPSREQAGIVDYCYDLSSDTIGDVDNDFEFAGSFSLSLWISETNTGDFTSPISNFGAANYGWDIIDVGALTRVIYWQIRGQGTFGVQGTTDINDGSFHHIAASYNADDDSMKLWVDASLEGVTYCPGPVYNTNCRFVIGNRHGAGAYFEGKIDEVGIYKGIEFTQTTVDSLFNDGSAKLYPDDFIAGQDTDSLRIQIIDFDESADSFRVVYKYDGYPSTPIDGTLLYAFSDTTNYGDTTAEWSGFQDTIVYFTLWSRAGGSWNQTPNKDTVFIDTSTTYTPASPEGYTIYWNVDFENHSVPVNYIFELQSPDFMNHWWFDSDHRQSPWNIPEVNDSLIEDPISGSHVLKYSFKSGTINGVDGQMPFHQGEGALIKFGNDPYATGTIGELQEVYLSYNVMLRPGWLPSGGGKFPGLGGGTMDYGVPCPPTESTNCTSGDPCHGWKVDYQWMWCTSCSGYNWYNSLGTYGSYQNMNTSVCSSAEYYPVQQYQPSGHNMNYHPSPSNAWYFDVSDSIWYNITIRYVMNSFSGSNPNSDGIIQTFINGYLVGSQTGRLFIGATDHANGLGINQLWWRHFWGGGGPPLRDEWSLFDDIVLWMKDDPDVIQGNTPWPGGTVLTLPDECDIDKVLLR